MKTTLDKILGEYRDTFRINDGILEIWERVLPDGDWEGRTATQKDLENWLSQKFPKYAKEIVERAKLKETPDFEDFNEELEWNEKERGTDSQIYNAGYDKALQDYYDNLLKELKI